MFTPDSIRTVEFTQIGKNGYRADEVDEFLEQAANYVDALNREKAQLMEKLQVLAEKVEEYRQDEDSIKTALLSAQRMGDKVMREAKEQSEKILEEANATSKEILEKAQSEASLLENKSRQRGEGIVALAQSKADEVTRSVEDKYKKQYAFYHKFKDEVESFKDTVLSQYMEHINLLKNLTVEMENHKMYEQAVPHDQTAQEQSGGEGGKALAFDFTEEEEKEEHTKGFAVKMED